jgi:hypothetical protein
MPSFPFGTDLPASAEEIPHRDDFVMNSIGGGEYRDYVMTYISVNEGLYLCTMHNTMHQLMTEFGVCAREQRGDEHVPDFGPHVRRRLDRVP